MTRPDRIRRLTRRWHCGSRTSRWLDRPDLGLGAPLIRSRYVARRP